MTVPSSFDGIEIAGPMQPQFDNILTEDALRFVADLHRRFNGRRIELLAKRQQRLELNVVPFTAVQELFRDQAPAPYLVILYRRAMIRIAEMIAQKAAIPALVTGEALGQVASQTLTNLSAIENAAGLPILRPLIGFDKAEVIALARKINSYDISIEPHEDCCSLFVPKHPETKAYLPYVHGIENKIDWQPRLQEAFEKTEQLPIISHG